MEQQFDDKMVVVFSQGASGDQNPLYLRPSTNALASLSGTRITGYEMAREPVEAPLRDGKVARHTLDPKVADNLERFLESQGQLLGEEVIRVMTHTTRRAASVRLWGAQKTLTCPARKRTNSGREGAPGTYEDSDDPVRIRLGVLGIGDTALATVNGEVYSAIGQRAKRQSPLTNTVVVTLANGRANSGYIPDDASFGAYTFQVLGSRLQPGLRRAGHRRRHRRPGRPVRRTSTELGERTLKARRDLMMLDGECRVDDPHRDAQLLWHEIGRGIPRGSDARPRRAARR